MPTLDFKAIKEIRMVDMCGRYGIQLRFRGEYANTCCPLPTHRDGDKSKSFSINLTGNYWRCFSASCNKNAGGKGGDCINFVALMEKCSQKDAAQKLADWFNVGKEKAAPRMETRPAANQPAKSYLENNISESGVKYMAAVDAWFDELFKRQPGEVDAEYWKRCRNGVKARLVESYRAGKVAAKT